MTKIWGRVMGWFLLVIVLLLGLLAWIVATASKPFRATLDGAAVASSASRPANRNRLQITVDGVEYDYTHHPLFQTIAPAMAQGDWGGVRRYLQKIAYGIKSASEQEQRNINRIREEMTSNDPDGIEPDEEMKLEAQVAANNGHVEAKGYDAVGVSAIESTKAKPARYTQLVNEAVESVWNVLGRISSKVKVSTPKR